MQQPTKYDQFADHYSEIFLDYNQKSTELFHQQFDFNLSEKKLLDLGCGDGKDLKRFAELGALLHGIDASNPMVQLATLNNPEAKIKEAYFEKLPFEANQFDVVCSKYALQASPDMQAIYQEVNRVLKPGGYFIFLVGHPIYQFLEKRKHPKDYFLKEIINVNIFDGKIPITEPTHTLAEFLSPYFLQHFDLKTYIEEPEDSIDKIEGDIYPCFLLIKAIKR